MAIITGSKKRHYLATVSALLVAIALIAAISGCYSDHPLPPCDSENLEIRTWYDLDAVRDNRCGNHTLMNDLNCSTAGYDELAGPMANGGSGWEPIGYSGLGELKSPFKGIFDGQGYEIQDLFIHSSHLSPFYEVGLFGLSSGVIKNIGVVNATVLGVGAPSVGALVGTIIQGTVDNSYSTGNVSGDDRVGGLVGANSQGTVIRCYSTGTVTGNRSVGGLVGEIQGLQIEATVSNSYSTGNVTGEECVGGVVGRSRGYGELGSTVSSSYYTGTVTGNRSVGGLVGENEGIVRDSYSTGNVTGQEYVGGLVGYSSDRLNWGLVSNSYCTGSVTGTSYVGGLVGWNDGGTVSNSFWDTETSGQATSNGGTGKTTMEMQELATFSGAGWDIIAVGSPGTRRTSYIWNIVDGVTYPFLSWQS
jgi:hypothetical protein